MLAPIVVAAVNVHDSILLPDSLRFLRRIIRALKLEIEGVELSLDSGFDGRKNRHAIWNTGLVPNIAENIRNRNTTKPKRGRPRYFNIKSYNSRSTVERTFAWQDTYRATVVRYSRQQAHFVAYNLLAFTLINLRHGIRKSK